MRCKVTFGDDETIFTAVTIGDIAICALIRQPLMTVAKITELVHLVDGHINRDRPISHCRLPKWMGVGIPPVEITDQMDGANVIEMTLNDRNNVYMDSQVFRLGAQLELFMGYDKLLQFMNRGEIVEINAD